MFNFILQWLDLLWIPLVFVFAARRHWITALILIVMCILTLRLQNELMTEIGHERGVLPFIEMAALYRGYFVYGAFILLFLLLSSFSRHENAYVYIAAAIGLFVISSCISMAVMFL